MTLTYIEEARMADLDAIMQIINDAKAFLKESGSTQWQEGYPDEEAIIGDLKERNGFVLRTEGQVAAYAAVTGQDPNYAVIDGAWANVTAPYAAIHRIAISSSFRGQHLAGQFLNQLIALGLSRGIRNFRVDTGKANAAMQHLASSHGFQLRGIIQVTSDSLDPSRLAYELNLPRSESKKEYAGDDRNAKD